jgi:hypothetical protein
VVLWGPCSLIGMGDTLLDLNGRRLLIQGLRTFGVFCEMQGKNHGNVVVLLQVGGMRNKQKDPAGIRLRPVSLRLPFRLPVSQEDALSGKPKDFSR